MIGRVTIWVVIWTGGLPHLSYLTYLGPPSQCKQALAHPLKQGIDWERGVSERTVAPNFITLSLLLSWVIDVIYGSFTSFLPLLCKLSIPSFLNTFKWTIIVTYK